MLCLFGFLFDDPPKRKPNESPGEIIKPFSFSKRKKKKNTSSEVNPKHNSFSLCEKVDLNGKIALVERGGKNDDGSPITFVQKEKAAYDASAIAMLVYDNVYGEIPKMKTDGLFPSAAISKSSGKFLLSHANEKINIQATYFGDTQDKFSAH